jgi:cell division protein FtsN
VNVTASPFPLALPRRSRRRFHLVAALPILSFAGALPILDIAQASRQGADPPRVSAPAVAEQAPFPEAERPATITLGALIEMQRRAREQRRALTEAERQLAGLPPGEAWQAQLGAFSSPEAAERQRAQLIEAGVPVVVQQAGELHRLQSLPAPREATETLCARAQAKGVDCFVRQAI